MVEKITELYVSMEFSLKSGAEYVLPSNFHKLMKQNFLFFDYFSQ
jgi:hypothetical protein